MKVLIEGAGIAGIALAGFLKKGGVDAVLIEKAPKYRNEGYGIFLWPLGKRVLGNFGMLDTLADKGVPISYNKLVNQHEKPIYKFDFQDVTKKYGDILGIKREDLYDSFLEAIGDLDVRFDTTIEKIHEHDSVATVTLSNGHTEDYDVVVGASGIRSHIREQVFPSAQVKYYGKSMWITWVKGIELPLTYSMSILGNGSGALIFPAGKDRHVVYLMAPAPKKHVYEDEKDRLSNIQKVFKGFTGIVPQVVKNLDDPSDIMHSSMTKVISNTWYRKRIVLIGDAEHAMSPISGIGTSLALEDAQVLSQELLAYEKEEIPTALERFAKRRKPRLVQASRLSNGLMFFLTPKSFVVCGARNFGVRHFLPHNFFIQQAMRMHEFVI